MHLMGNQVFGSISSAIPSMTFISRVTASASASLDFTSSIDSTYKVYKIVLDQILCSAIGGISFRMSPDALSTFATIDSTRDVVTVNTTFLDQKISSSNSTFTLASTDIASAVMEGVIDIYYPADATLQTLVYSTCSPSSGSTSAAVGRYIIGQDAARQTINSFRIIPAAGTITSGTATLYGSN
jgi:hypothetical protein